MSVAKPASMTQVFLSTQRLSSVHSASAQRLSRRLSSVFQCLSSIYLGFYLASIHHLYSVYLSFSCVYLQNLSNVYIMFISCQSSFYLESIYRLSSVYPSSFFHFSSVDSARIQCPSSVYLASIWRLPNESGVHLAFFFKSLTHLPNVFPMQCHSCVSLMSLFWCEKR